MHTGTHARMQARMPACTHAGSHARMPACTHARTHAHMHTFTHARVRACGVRACSPTCLPTCSYMSACTHVRMHACACVAYAHLCVHRQRRVAPTDQGERSIRRRDPYRYDQAGTRTHALHTRMHAPHRDVSCRPRHAAPRRICARR